MRIDNFRSFGEILESFATSKENPFLYKYQLAESFMRQVAFKLGKLEKFGAWIIIKVLIIHNKMSVYSGFATRHLECFYDQLVSKALELISEKILAFYNGCKSTMISRCQYRANWWAAVCKEDVENTSHIDKVRGVEIFGATYFISVRPLGGLSEEELQWRGKRLHKHLVNVYDEPERNLWHWVREHLS